MDDIPENKKMQTTALPQQKSTKTSAPSAWQSFFMAVGIFQLCVVAVYLWLMNEWVANPEIAIIVFILLFTAVPAVLLVALINLIGLPIFMTKRHMKPAEKIFYIVSLIISLAMELYFVYGFFLS